MSREREMSLTAGQVVGVIEQGVQGMVVKPAVVKSFKYGPPIVDKGNLFLDKLEDTDGVQLAMPQFQELLGEAVEAEKERKRIELEESFDEPSEAAESVLLKVIAHEPNTSMQALNIMMTQIFAVQRKRKK